MPATDPNEFFDRIGYEQDQVASAFDEELSEELEDALLDEMRQDITLCEAISRELAQNQGIGQYLGELRDQAHRAIKQFPDFDLELPETRSKARDCQTAIRMYLHAIGFIRDAITKGASADAQARTAASNRRGDAGSDNEVDDG